MHPQQDYFTSVTELKNYILANELASHLVGYRHVEGYAGMALCIIIRFDGRPEKYRLQLEWMSLGLDLYGDTLQESYEYGFNSLEEMLAYLETKYDIRITGIPVKYKFEDGKFPNPIYNTEERPLFEEAWQRFQKDFGNGAFLEAQLARRS